MLLLQLKIVLEIVLLLVIVMYAVDADWGVCTEPGDASGRSDGDGG